MDPQIQYPIVFEMVKDARLREAAQQEDAEVRRKQAHQAEWLRQTTYPFSDPSCSSSSSSLPPRTKIVVRRKAIKTYSSPAPTFLPPYLSRLFWADPSGRTHDDPAAHPRHEPHSKRALLDVHGGVAASVCTTTTSASCPSSLLSGWFWASPPPRRVNSDEEAARNMVQTWKTALALRRGHENEQTVTHKQETKMAECSEQIKDENVATNQEGGEKPQYGIRDSEAMFFPLFHDY